MNQLNIIVYCLLLVGVWAHAEARAEAHANLCPAVKICLNETLSGCPATIQQNKRINYDSVFCAPFKELKARGLSAENPVGREIYTKLSGEYRVLYESQGTVAATASMMSFLFDHMPFTAELINAYQDAKYELNYTNKSHTSFSGTNGRSLSGDFIWALQDSAGVQKGFRNVFLGYGRAKVLKWSLRGTAIAFLDMNPMPGGLVQYRLRAVVFPANSILNSIMQMRLFKAVVSDKIDHIVQDVVQSAQSFAKGNKKPIEKLLKEKETAVQKMSQDKKNTKPAPHNNNMEKNSKRFKETLEEFERVVKGKSWTLGDALKSEK